MQMLTGEYPQTFTKPPSVSNTITTLPLLIALDALAGPFDDILIHPECQWMDYEVRLVPHQMNLALSIREGRTLCSHRPRLQKRLQV